MPVVILRKPITPSIECDAVEEFRNGASPSSVGVEEYEAMGRRNASEKKELISRITAAAMFGITPRTLLRRHEKNFGPKREEVSQGRYGYRKAEVEAWVAEHGQGSHRPRSGKGG
jgi:predicted DNA-binding transcriptional regulator AlpA